MLSARTEKERAHKAALSLPACSDPGFPPLREHLRIATACLAALGVACAGSAPAPTPAPPPASTSVPESSLRLVPRGASLVLHARVSRLFQDPVTAPVLEVLLPRVLRDRFARRTGVEIEELEEVVYAELGPGSLVLARGAWPAVDVVRGASLRMNTIDVQSSTPRVRRAGFIGDEYYDLVAIDEHRVMVARDDRSIVPTVVHRLDQGAWSEGRGASFDSPVMTRLVSEAGEAAVVLYGPMPPQVTDPTSGGNAGVLLGAIQAFSAILRPVERANPSPGERDPGAGDGDLELEIDCRGRFPSTAADNFRNLVLAVAETDLGSALGMNRVPESLTVQASNDGRVTVSLRLEGRRLAWGLRVLLGGTLRDLMVER